MTPFGLRKRIKGIFGGGERDAAVKHAIVFVYPNGDEKTVEAEDRYTMVMASQLATPIDTKCPDGHCGECVVDVLAGGGLNTPLAAENKAFEHGQGRPEKPNERLACHARIVGSGARIGVRKVWTMEDNL